MDGEYCVLLKLLHPVTDKLYEEYVLGSHKETMFSV